MKMHSALNCVIIIIVLLLTTKSSVAQLTGLSILEARIDRMLDTALQRNVLFDLSLELANFKIKASDNITATIGLLNVGKPGEVNAYLDYKILNSEGKTIYSESERIEVQTQTQFLKEFDTSQFEGGKYSVVVNLTYGGQIEPAIAEQAFQVSSPKDSPKLILLGSAAVTFIGAGLLYTVFRRKKNKGYAAKNEK